MMNSPIVAWLAATVIAAQGPAEMPEAWMKKIEAAEQAKQSGAYAKAELLLQEVVGEAEKLGVEDLRLAMALEALGGFYLTRKRYDEAEPLLRRTLAIREKKQGPHHPGVANTLVSLAMGRLIRDAKEPENAAPMLRRAMMILEKAKGKDSPEMASCLQTRMARPVALTRVEQSLFGFPPGDHQQGIRLGPAFPRPRLDSVGPVPHLIAGDRLEQDPPQPAAARSASPPATPSRSLARSATPP